MKSVTVENGAQARASKSNGSSKLNGSKTDGKAQRGKPAPSKAPTVKNGAIATAAEGAKARRAANVLLNTLIAFKRGDFTVRMPVDQTDLEGKVADALNDVLEINQKMVSEFERISRAVGKDGKITQRAYIGSVTGAWADCVESVNSLIGDLVQPSTEVARVIGAVAKGDLSQNMSLEVDGRPLRGEFLHTARVVNTMVQQLNSFASEVTRVAREVGTEGKLGGQAVVPAVAGTWQRFDGKRQFDGQQPDQPGAKHRGCDHGRRERRFDDAHHGGRARRNSAVEEHHQYDGGPAQLVRRRSNARGARSGNRRPPGRTGRSARRRRSLEGFDRFGQLNGGQPDQPGA